MTGPEAAARQTEPGRLFEAFERLSGQSLRFTYLRQWATSQLHGRGVTAADIELVYRFTQAMQKRGKCGFNELSLTFGAMCQEPDKFEDRLAVARAWRRPAAAPAPKSLVPDPKPAPDPALFARGAAAMAAWKAGRGTAL